MTRPSLLKDEWLDPAKSFAFPAWDRVHAWVEQAFEKSEHHQIYCELAGDWVARIVRRFPVPMTVSESRHFIVAVPTVAANSRQCLAQLEDYRAQIHTFLSGLDLFPWVGKSVVIIAPDLDTFVRYLADYFGPGHYMMPGGVCLRRGYIHFVMPETNLTRAAPVLAHELCHVCVANYPWPLWVEEGVVQTVEQKVSSSAPYRLNHEFVRRHRTYWTQERLKDFWAGKSFFSPDEGSELSYHLARFLLEAAAQQGRALFLDFLRAAHRNDSGFAAMRDAIGASPEELVWGLLGWNSRGSIKANLAF